MRLSHERGLRGGRRGGAKRGGRKAATRACGRVRRGAVCRCSRVHIFWGLRFATRDLPGDHGQQIRAHTRDRSAGQRCGPDHPGGRQRRLCLGRVSQDRRREGQPGVLAGQRIHRALHGVCGRGGHDGCRDGLGSALHVADRTALPGLQFVGPEPGGARGGQKEQRRWADAGANRQRGLGRAPLPIPQRIPGHAGQQFRRGDRPAGFRQNDRSRHASSSTIGWPSRPTTASRICCRLNRWTR